MTAASIAGAVAASGRLAAELDTAIAHAAAANHELLALGAVFFLLAPVCTGLAWQAALQTAGGRLGATEACARYGVGSLVNSVTPLRIGDGVRIALFARALPGGTRLRSVGALAALKLARLTTLVVLAAAGTAKPWLIGLAALCVSALIALVRATGSCPLILSVAAATGARIGAVAAVLAALGVGAAVTRACLIVPALALAGVLPLTPGNVGLASAAVAVSLHFSGVPAATGVPAGIVLHGVETAAGLSFGAASAVTLGALHVPWRLWPRRFVTRISPARRPRLAG